jgi:hypothetical protein
VSDQAKDHETLLAAYIGGPVRLESAIAGLSESDIDLASAPGGWSMRHIIHHVVDRDDMGKLTIKAALGNTGGTIAFDWYGALAQELWAARWNYAGRMVAPSLALFRANRHHVYQLMKRIPDAWGRSIRVLWPQSEPARVSVADVIDKQVRHVAHHVEEIARIRKIHDF